MKKFLILILVLVIFNMHNVFSQTYGNWSGKLQTGAQPASVSIPYQEYFPDTLVTYLQKAYKDRYVRVIKYVVKKGERYTVSIKYPLNGTSYGWQFTGNNPWRTEAFSTGFGSANIQGRYTVQRVNFTNSTESKYDWVFVVVITDKPSSEFYLRIQYPAVPDNVVDAPSVNPADPQGGKVYWGSIVEHPIILR
ncbi:MAG: hypothetical protein L3J74_14555 [Bacteroidales bacterium]|nr:hypothetical protein [Bacteroidales bacterium]